MKKMIFTSLATGGILLGMSGITLATSLIGDTIHIYRGYQDSTATTIYENFDVVVGDAIESVRTAWKIDITSNSIDFTASQGGWRFADWGSHEYQFSSLDFDDGSSIVGLDLSFFSWKDRVQFSSHSVTINIDGFDKGENGVLDFWDKDDTWSIGLISGPQPVPEPSTLLLLFTGFVGIFWSRLRVTNEK